MNLLRNRELLSLSALHFLNDFFSGSIPILLAAHTLSLGLSLSQVGQLALAFSFASSLSQPLFGLVADGPRAPWLALGGALCTVIFFGVAGFAPSFGVLLLLVLGVGLGSGAFHPPGGGNVSRVVEPARKNSATSIFLLGGNSGYAVGPLVAGMVFAAGGPRGSLGMTVAALALVPVLIWLMGRLRGPLVHDHVARTGRHASGEKVTVSAGLILSIVLLMLVILFRMGTAEAMKTYIPQLYLERGINDLGFSGQVSFIYLISSALGVLFFGFMADRVGRYLIITASLFISAPLLYALVHAQGEMIFVWAALLGFMVNASLSITLLIGQEMVPGKPGLMTGLTLGYSFIAGGIGTAAIGGLSDAFGLEVVLNWIPAMLVVGGFVGLLFWVVQRRPARMPATVVEEITNPQSAR